MKDVPELPLFYCIRLLRFEGPTNQTMAGWSLDFDKIDKALDFLNIYTYTKVRFTTSIWKSGEHQDSQDFHLILLSQSWGIDEANETLWHELIHARQAEDYSRINGVPLSEFSKVYAAAKGPIGRTYRGNRFEIEAYDLSAKYCKVQLLIENQNLT